MNILRILIESIVVFLAGLLVIVLALLVAGLLGGALALLFGLPGEFMLIICGLCAIAGGYFTFVKAVSTKALHYWALGFVAPLACFALVWLNLTYFPSLMNPALTTIEVRQALEKCSCEREIQAEVDRLLNRPVDSSLISRHKEENVGDVDLAAAPSLNRFGDTLGDLTFKKIVPRGYYEPGMPDHLRLSFQHFPQQYILWFRTGTDASLVESHPYEHVTDSVYFKRGSFVPRH